MPELNSEKEEILKAEGNILVTANPGTGKTRLLAYKFLSAVQKGLSPEKILCLTFTDKAKKEMEERITKLLTANKIIYNPSKLNIYTFHAYALDNIGHESIVSSNLLRYTIYEYLKENNVFNYPDSYILESIIPKIENLISYLKTFGITLDKIDIEQAKVLLQEDDNFSLKEKYIYADEFVNIYKRYEEIKHGNGVDYADLLINFLNLPKIPKFDLVLVDELQDVNKMEADIAIFSGNQYFAVGDKKQAIFGFQGGSIKNFESFKDSKQFILSDNFRNTNEILNYAREYFISKTKDESHRSELENLRSHDNKSGQMPIIYEINSKLIPSAVRHLVINNLEEGKKIAVIARFNSHLMNISSELSGHGISFSSTYMGASIDAKANIIRFLKGMFSKNLLEIKKAMLTPFSPIPLQDAFEIFDKKDLNLEMLYDFAPTFMKLRDSVKTVEDVNTIFREVIIPIATSYGKEYLSASNKMYKAFQEALSFVNDLTLNNLLVYLEATDLTTDELELESQITLTTVHKAKGKEYDIVIYVPSEPRDRSNYQDEVVEAILKTNGTDVKEELEEESLRINFVAFTRAKSKLFIATNSKSEFINEYSNEGTLEVAESKSNDFSETRIKAISLFLNDDIVKARELLKTKQKWLVEYVSDHFRSLDRLSYSYIKDKPFDYFEKCILGIYDETTSMNIGTDAHTIAEKLINGEDFECSDEMLLHKRNIESLLAPIQAKYPDVHSIESKYTIPLSEIISTDENITFVFKIDAIFRNGDKYLILDWKTDMNMKRASDHRQQLEAYRRAFCVLEGIDLDRVDVAIGFVALRDRIDTGRFDCHFDDKPPVKTSFNNFAKKVIRILTWKQDPELYFQELINEAKHDDALWRSIFEQYKLEITG